MLLKFILFTKSAWLLQKYIRAKMRKEMTQQVHLYEYNHGAYDVVISGEAGRISQRVLNLVDTRVEQLVNTEPDGILVSFFFTHHGGIGFGLTGRHRGFVRYWLNGVYEFTDAFTEIAGWCKKEDTWISTS